MPRCQSLAHTLTSLSTHITNPLQDLQHVSCLTSMTRLQLSIDFPQASQPGALDQMTAQITQITGLKALRLYNFPHSSAKSMSLGLSNLQELESAGFGPVLDVQHCTQLTCLDGEGSLKQVYLPAGQLCCLEQLSLNITSGCTLFNLGDALRLSSLAFIKQCPIDVQRVSSSTFTNSSSAGSWPLLPSLHSLRIGVMRCAPPAIWAKYGSFCELELASYRHPMLPAWFADLTSLKKLTLGSTSLQQFPSSVLELTQLQELCLCLTIFPKYIVQFASFLHLSSLILRLDCSVKVSANDAHLPAFQDSVRNLEATLLKRLPNASVRMVAGGRGWTFEQNL